jgi:DNA-binding transcriptional ArsR family regulator
MAKRDQKQELLDAVRHPIRRSLLRRFLESTEMLSPKELSDLENESLSVVSYHVRELDKLGAIETAGDQQVRGRSSTSICRPRGSRGRRSASLAPAKAS